MIKFENFSDWRNNNQTAKYFNIVTGYIPKKDSAGSENMSSTMCCKFRRNRNKYVDISGYTIDIKKKKGDC